MLFHMKVETIHFIWQTRFQRPMGNETHFYVVSLIESSMVWGTCWIKLHGWFFCEARELFWLKRKNGFCKQWSCLNNKTSSNAHRIEIFVWPICSHISRSFHAFKAQFCNWYRIHNLAHLNDYNGISDFYFFTFAKVVVPRWCKGNIQLQKISW